MFNVIGAVIFGIGMTVFFAVNPSFGTADINSVQISMFHTVFNVTNTLLLFPFAKKLVSLSELVIRDTKESEEEQEITGNRAAAAG